MVLSDERLRSIVARASTLPERLTSRQIAAGDGDPVLVNRRFNRWAALAGRSDPAAIQRLLGWDGLDTETFRSALGPARPSPDAPLPGWAQTLQAALELTDCTRPDSDATPSVEAFVRLAQQRLALRAGAAYHLLCDQAHASAAGALLDRLTNQAAPALRWRAALARNAKTGGSSLRSRSRSPRHMADAELADLIDEYPMLGRLLATQVNLWIDSHVEFLHRLHADRSTLGQVFGGGADPGKVVRISPSLSDPHNGGREVVGLTFESRLKLIYKPKGLAMEAAFLQIVQWLDHQGWATPLRTPHVLQRSTHGWMESVGPLACNDTGEAHRYFERAGALLCLVHALEGMDVHQENLIACGEHPILIDLETLLHPRPVAQERASAVHSSAIDGQALEHSVLRTGMLPFSESFFDYHLPEDISGLGGSAAAGSSHCADDRPAGEPGAQVRSESAVPSREPNLPIHDGRALRAEDHEDDLVAGFAGMYDFLQARRQRLLADDGPLRWLADCPVRFLFRDTRTYALLFERLWHPPYLRDGVDWSIETAVLYRAAAGLGEKPRFWPLIAAEIVALQRLDVPLFTVSSTSDVVTMGGGEMVEGLFEAPSLHLVRRRIERLCKEDLDQQVSWIRRSLYRARLRGAVRPAPVAMALDGPAHADTASSSLPKGGHRDE